MLYYIYSDTEIDILVRQVQRSEIRILVYLQLIVSRGVMKSLQYWWIISLTGCWHPAITHILGSRVPQSLKELVSRSTSLKEYSAHTCTIWYYLLQLVTSDALTYYPTTLGPFIAEVTKHNKLQQLHLLNCCISDRVKGSWRSTS